MKKISLVLGALVVCVAVAACGDDDSGASNKGGGGSASTCDPANTSGGDTPECLAYSKCEQQACDAEYKQCLGPGYASGQFGGECSEYMSCVAQCNCDKACTQQCFPKLAGACQTCFTGTLGACTQSNCQAEQKACSDSQKGAGGAGGTNGSGGAGGTSSGAGCAELSTCCPQLQNADQKSSCEQLVATKADAQCGAVLQGFKSGALCK